MSLIENIIRPEIRALSAYHVPDASGFIKLDAMENPYLLPEDMRAELGQRLADVALNRYPVPSYETLKKKIGARLGVPPGFGLILGNGSDELIALLSIACANPGAKVLAPTPGFVMYSMSARFSGMQFVGVPLKADFSLDMPAMLAAIAEHRPAITYLAYPNNPSGNLYDADDMVRIIEAIGETGIV
ncbi:MAG TPA: aminotransferase class I/II-fold pyridoxal phosphate-dependent enzyme, partial [Noviherbaspirillum sp.]|nr:aminotransferase class I/II-fold pyridoxal phosphate-dependent enzyme [Noviherbaspirillum sp.]